MGKKMWISRIKEADISTVEDFSNPEGPSYPVTAYAVNQATDLLVDVYTKNGDKFEGSDVAKLWVHRFLHNESTLLMLLPLTEVAFVCFMSNSLHCCAAQQNCTVCQPSSWGHARTVDEEQLTAD